MTTAANASSLRDWVDLFFLYGPFFITLFIMIYGIRQAKAAVDNAEQAKPRDQEALRLHRRIYVSVWIFSGVLVVACCAWWFINFDNESKKKYVLRMDISDAQPTDRFEPKSQDVFVRTQDITDPNLRRDEFVVVQEKPFVNGDEIEIVHKKGADAVFRYPIRLADLDARKGSAFKLVFENGLYKLVPKHPPGGPAGKSGTQLLGIGMAYAEYGRAIVAKPIILKDTAPRPAQAAIPNSSFPNPPSMPAKATVPVTPMQTQDIWTDQLSQKRQTIGRQIDALEALEQSLAKNRDAIDLLRPIATAESKGETLLSLLLNLSRHQDKLLAYKAQSLLDKTGYLSAVIRVATATSGYPPEVQRQILIVLNEKQWESVAAAVAEHQKAGVSRQQNTYARTATPVPSATFEGTRFFALISWPALNDNQAKCLAEKLYRHNIEATSLADQQRYVAKGNSLGFVFDSRAEATVFADSVKPCGAKTDFVYNGDKRLAAAGR